MTELTYATSARIDALFEENLRAEVRSLLAVQCAENLPLWRPATPEGLERIRYAVLKLSGGRMEDLQEAVRIAQIDWRDVLVAAGFGNDPHAHQNWWPDDVPSPIDLRRMPDAVEWEQSALSKRPWRTEFSERFASEIATAPRRVHRVLELGSGPGFLAKLLLESCKEISYVLLDFSPAMHELAKVRLAGLESRVQFIERDFKEDQWWDGLGRFDCVVTHQAVHELRHKRHARRLHSQVWNILQPDGLYLVCDHFAGAGGMQNPQLYMSAGEQKVALEAAGFLDVEEILVKGSLVLHRAI